MALQQESRSTLDHLRRLVGPLAVVATVGMFIVVIMGATVTDTNSAMGCGRSWPLCHGVLIPKFALSTLIEFSHRAVTGVESILIILLTLAVVLFWRRRELWILGAAMMVFLLLQAGLGAAAVLWPQAPAVLALHLGISLIAFASVALTMVAVRSGAELRQLRQRPAPIGFRWAAWAVAVYAYLVVYSGAYVRHAGAGLACMDWPSCNGPVWISFQGWVGIVVVHRLVAFGVGLAILALAVRALRLRRSRPDLFAISLTALGLVILQGLIGGLVVMSHLDLFATLAHTAVVALLFASLCLLCRQTLTDGGVAEAQPAAGPAPVAVGQPLP